MTAVGAGGPVVTTAQPEEQSPGALGRSLGCRSCSPRPVRFIRLRRALPAPPRAPPPSYGQCVATPALDCPATVAPAPHESESESASNAPIRSYRGVFRQYCLKNEGLVGDGSKSPAAPRCPLCRGFPVWARLVSNQRCLPSREPKGPGPLSVSNLQGCGSGHLLVRPMLVTLRLSRVATRHHGLHRRYAEPIRRCSPVRGAPLIPPRSRLARTSGCSRSQRRCGSSRPRSPRRRSPRSRS